MPKLSGFTTYQDFSIQNFARPNLPWKPEGDIFLAEAIDIFGKDIYEEKWTGQELTARYFVFFPIMPDWGIKEKRYHTPLGSNVKYKFSSPYFSVKTIDGEEEVQTKGAHINERKTLAATAGVPTTEIRLAQSNASFANGTWSTSLPEIAIFDSTFVAQNVHAGECVDRAQRRNLLQVIIGQAGVALSQQVDTLDALIAKKNSEINELKKSIQHHTPKGQKIEDFISLTEDADVDQKITATEKSLVAAKRAGEIKSRAVLTEISLPAIPADLKSVLTKTLDGVSADTAKKVKEHISKHQMQEHGQAWLAKGLDYIHDDECAFCGTNTKNIDLVETYKQFFSQAYKDLQAEISHLKAASESAMNDAATARINQALTVNDGASEFWKQFVDIAAPQLDTNNAITNPVSSLRNAIGNLIAKKLAAPLESIETDAAFEQAEKLYADAQQAIEIYNKAVRDANALIATKKQETDSADITSVENKLALLKLTKTRYEAQPKSVCDAYVKAKTEKDQLDLDKAAAKEALDQHADTTIQKYESTINTLLKGFGASFSITNSKKTYVGGTPASAYQILINDHPVDLGDSDTPIGTPSFRTTMSAGDKSTLALAFFIAQLEHDPNKANRIVVFDDPFNSQDRSRRERTAELLKKYGGECKQLFLLSHDPFFLKLVYDRFPAANTRTLQLSRAANNNTSIEDWDVVKETQEGYFRDHAALSSYMLNGSRSLIDVARKIRPVLEGYLRYRFPSQFPDDKWLGDMIGIIRTAGQAHPLHDILSELDGINDYSKKYHHDTNPGQADNTPVDDGELKSFSGRTLHIAGGY